MANWNMVAYNTALSALKRGQSASSVMAAGSGYKGGKYAPYYQNAVNKFNSEKKAATPKTRRSSSRRSSSPAPAAAAPAYKAPSYKPPPPPPPAPTLNLPMLGKLPELNMSDETSVENQLGRMTSKDSMLRQQARINAQERGVASGAIHSSQQGGAAERAVIDIMAPLADAEATREAGQEIGNWQQETNRLAGNWQQETNQRIKVYEAKYGERIARMGFNNQIRMAQIQANTSLTTAMLASTTSLMNNTDLDLSQGAWDKIRGVVNEGQEFNMNTIGAFSYG
jgi:hypothetical protein